MYSTGVLIMQVVMILRMFIRGTAVDKVSAHFGLSLIVNVKVIYQTELVLSGDFSVAQNVLNEYDIQKCEAMYFSCHVS